MTLREGQAVPAHYGSAPGELAVCIRSVGLAHRPDLAVLSVNGSARGLVQLLTRVVGYGLAPGGTTFEAGAWWSRSSSETEIVIVCRRNGVGPLMRSLRRGVGDFYGVQLTDRSGDRALFNVIGRRAEEVLAEVGAFGPTGDPHDIPPFSDGSINGHPVKWLLEGSTAAFLLTDPRSAPAVWQAIEDAGRPYGLSRVGLEAIERYALIERAARRSVSVL